MAASSLVFKFECKFCGRTYKNEAYFLKHTCKEKQRHKESRTMLGRLAYAVYKKWIKKKNGVAAKSSFLTSKYYPTFIKIAQFIYDADIASVDDFVKFMCDSKFMPNLWYNNEAYVKYIRYLDKSLPPLTAVKMSVNTIIKKSEELGVETSDFFDVVDPHEIVHFLETRRLSPWLLFKSRKFEEFYKKKASADVRIIIDAFLNPDTWIPRFDANKRVMKRIDSYLDEMGL